MVYGVPMTVEEIFGKMLNENYYTARELKYDTNPGLFVTPFQYKQLLEHIDFLADKNEEVIGLNLGTFNTYKLHFANCNELLDKFNDYISLVIDDVVKNDSWLYFRNIDTITKSRIFSEIEGSLNIESVPTTRKLLNDIIYKKRKPVNNNEQIILNMSRAIEYANKCPDFNKENLFELYSFLSMNCLDDEDKLKEGDYYRYDDVEIDDYNGCPYEKVESRMDSLFEFVAQNLNNNKIKYLLPHIAHYYILYIHPYFDLNGRTARMVSYWIFLLLDQHAFPPVISEAINQTKNEYYTALRETRNSHNDLTYFLIYIFDISIKYFLTYKNIESIEQRLKEKSIVISETDKVYIKKILISSKGKFTYEDFIKWINAKITKQGAFKILNCLVGYGFLNSQINKSNKKIFSVNELLLQYRIIKSGEIA